MSADEPGPETKAPAGPEPSFSALADEAVGRLREIGLELLRVLRLRVAKARLGVREAAFRVALGLWLGVVVLAATVFGVARLVSGLAGLLGHALGSSWYGDLAAGAILIGGMALAVLGGRAWLRRAGLARLRREFDAAEPSVVAAAERRPT